MGSLAHLLGEALVQFGLETVACAQELLEFVLPMTFFQRLDDIRTTGMIMYCNVWMHDARLTAGLCYCMDKN